MSRQMPHRYSIPATLLLVAFIAITPLAAQGPAWNRQSTLVKSPEVLPDHRVVFRLWAPNAKEVKVVGDWIDSNHRGSNRPLQKDDQGIWSITEGPLVPDFYNYSFMLDGIHILDPMNGQIKQGSNSVDSVFEVPGPEAAFEDTRHVPHGYVSEVWYYSDAAAKMRRMHVYTPPGYNTGTAKYPVFYLLHGGGDDDSSWSTIGRAGFIIDNLIADGKAKPMIVVMPTFSGLQPENPAGAGGGGAARGGQAQGGGGGNQDLFVKELTEVVIPNIEKNFRVVANRENRAIAGLSMGGAMTLRIGPSHLDVFSHIGVFSMGLQKGATQGVPDDFEERNAQFLKNSAETNKLLKIFWIGVGKDDDRIRDGGQVLSEMLTRYGIKNEYHPSTGGHSWINWRHYLNEYAPRLFR